LRVKALPASGRPPGFSGAVGTFKLRVALDREQTRVNDAVGLKAVVEGPGFLKLAGPPIVGAASEIKMLDPKITESFDAGRKQPTSRKTWEWILLPLVQGDLRLPEVRFEYFDPTEGAYRTARAELPTLVVERGETGDAPGRAHGEIQVQRRDIAFIKPLRGPLGERRATQERSLFVLALGLPLLWVPALIAAGRWRARLESDAGLARNRRARARARKRLATVRRRVEELDAATFHEEAGRALVEYVADRFDRSAAGLTYDMAEELLASRGVEPDLRRRFRNCLESCDFARFVPAANRADRRAELLDEATALVEALERAW
jgi:hypothetical protein